MFNIKIHKPFQFEMNVILIQSYFNVYFEKMNISFVLKLTDINTYILSKMLHSNRSQFNVDVTLKFN